jgi:L,D-peptidoglycan transpeptidase YkuD (ErfK/YbiS/YcfS/YnhG family)
MEMALKRKQAIAGLSAILLIGAGAYELWLNMALRTRPWQLESYVNVLAGDCRTGPGASVFADDLNKLAAQVNEAKLCLLFADEAWAVNRDFTPCVQKLLAASLNANRIRLDEAIWVQDERFRLSIFLKTLALEVDGEASARKAGASFEVRNYARTRAETLLAGARDLVARGQIESALIEALRARSAWAENKDFVEAELARFNDSGHLAQWERAAQKLLLRTRQTNRSAILVNKLEHRCLLLTSGRVEKSYVANLGINWYRVKVQEHDSSTPEGEYKIKGKFRSASFGWALLLDYPNAADRQRFGSLKKAGQIPAHAGIGGNIEIHGGGRTNSDWTEGCVSLENADMAELYARAYVGMPVTIVGSCRLGNQSND